MDQQLIQQLTQAVQGMLQILQQAGSGTAPNAADPAAADDGNFDDSIPPAPEDDSADGEEFDKEPEGMGAIAGNADPNAQSGGSLHDRVAQLENHTGLKKSATSLPLLSRIDALEEHWLGEPYDGRAIDRVAQLEKAAGLHKSADAAPDVIPLDALIKSAVDSAVDRVRAEMRSNELPSPGAMRKAAQTVRAGERKSQQPVNRTDTDLIKAARDWGLEGDLDAPVSFGDILTLQSRADRIGNGLLLDEDD